MADMEQTKKKPAGRVRWSPIDVFLILLVILTIGGFVFRFVYANSRARAEDTRTLYDVTFQIESIHRATLSRIEAGDMVWMHDPVSASEALGYMEAETDEETGQQIAALHALNNDGIGDDRVTAVGTLVCTDARMADGFLMVDGCPQCLAPGTEITVCTERVTFTLKVMAIRLHEGS